MDHDTPEFYLRNDLFVYIDGVLAFGISLS
jgi:hypothetical protein